MRKFLQLRLCLPGLFLLTQIFPVPLAAQSWDLVKEQDGIKAYTRHEAGKSVKSYKGTAVIQASAEKVFSLIEDVHHTEWWDPNIIQIKVLSYEKNKSARYYLLYDAPWPVSKRDLYVDVIVNHDLTKNIFTVRSVPLPGVIAEDVNRVRIKNYSQTWTVSSAGENLANVVVEGYVDPAGNIPTWISNMVATEAPINTIRGIRKRVETRSLSSLNKPAEPPG